MLNSFCGTVRYEYPHKGSKFDPSHFQYLSFSFGQFPGLVPCKKLGNHRKSYMVVHENVKVIESSIEVYGNIQVIIRPYYSMIPCKSYTVLKYGHSMEKHALILLD